MVKAFCLLLLGAALTGCGPQVHEQFRPRSKEWSPPDAPSDDGLFASWSDYYRYQARGSYYYEPEPCDRQSDGKECRNRH